MLPLLFQRPVFYAAYDLLNEARGATSQDIKGLV